MSRAERERFWRVWRESVAEDTRFLAIRLPLAMLAIMALYCIAFRVVWGEWPGW